MEIADLGSAFGEAVDAWLEVVVQWLELWTCLVLSTDENRPLQTHDNLWDATVDAPVLTGWGKGGTVHLQFSRDAATAVVVDAAVRRASAGEPPPTEWLLMLRAGRLNDRHQAVIAAAVASEVALSRAVDARLPALPPGTRERIVHNANGVVGLVELLETLDGITTDSRRKRVAHRLAGPRNDAVHGGVVPTEDALGSALGEARALLDLYSPLPHP